LPVLPLDMLPLGNEPLGSRPLGNGVGVGRPGELGNFPGGGEIGLGGPNCTAGDDATRLFTVVVTSAIPPATASAPTVAAAPHTMASRRIISSIPFARQALRQGLEIPASTSLKLTRAGEQIKVNLHLAREWSVPDQNGRV